MVGIIQNSSIFKMCLADKASSTLYDREYYHFPQFVLSNTDAVMYLKSLVLEHDNSRLTSLVTFII